MVVVPLKSEHLGERLPKGLAQALRCGKGNVKMGGTDGWSEERTLPERDRSVKLDDLVGLA